MKTELLLTQLASIEPDLQLITQQAPVVVTLDPVRTAGVLNVLHRVLGQILIAADDAAEAVTIQNILASRMTRPPSPELASLEERPPGEGQ